MTIFIIYCIGFFIVPILLIFFDKVFKGSMDLKNSLESALLICSLLWPVGLIAIFFKLLSYWNEKN